MSKKTRKNGKSSAVTAGGERKSNKNAVRLMLTVAGACLISSLLYFAAQNSESMWKPVMIAWIAAASVTIIAYFIINKGFTENNLTVEMLSDRMSYDEKLAFIERAETRKKKTSWMLVLFIALITPIMIDLLRLYTLDTILSKL